MNTLSVISCLLLYKTCLLPLSLAWKPIVHGGGSSFTTSFTLQQSHPELGHGALSPYTFSTDEQNAELIASSSASRLNEPTVELLKDELLLGGSSSSASSGSDMLHATLGQPITNFNYGDDYFGKSYGVARDHTAGGGYREDTCAVKKYAFNADGIAKYDSELPELNQFTICFWMRFTNHSGDHVPLTYSTGGKHGRAIQFWVANAQNSSFLSMAIKGQQMYRLNYPLRVRQWHHICSSWNGKTGEWQVWLKAERIGRGFHNSLVGHKIPANGKLYSGGPSFTGDVAVGLHFEVTLVQIYRIALSAGKAHRDHKHHHAHHFDHEGQEVSTTTKTPPVINRPLAMHNLLANGQIPTRVRINLAQPGQADVVQKPQSQQQQQQQQQQQLQLQLIDEKLLGSTVGDRQTVHTIHTNFVNGQINAGSRLVAQQLVGLANTPPLRQETVQTTQMHKFNNPSNVQFVDESETRIFFKRQAVAEAPAKLRNATDVTAAAATVGAANAVTPATVASKKQKRGLVLLKDGSVVEDGLVDDAALTDFGGQQFKHDLTSKHSNIDDQVAEHDREPAEEEVKAVMALCGTCDVEPFKGAIVFAWKDVHADLDNALQGYSVGGCGKF